MKRLAKKLNWTRRKIDKVVASERERRTTPGAVSSKRGDTAALAVASLKKTNGLKTKHSGPDDEMFPNHLQDGKVIFIRKQRSLLVSCKVNVNKKKFESGSHFFSEEMCVSEFGGYSASMWPNNELQTWVFALDSWESL